MEKHIHRMTELFAQLGLPSSPDDIRRFVDSNRPVPAHLTLHEAPFWNHAQAGFLREAVMADADWSGVIDVLDVALRNSEK
jgi:hypothetical protein